MMISARPYSSWKPDYSWDLPGGTNHRNEPGNHAKECTCEAAERETQEEAQIKVRAIAKTSNHNVFVCEYISDDHSLHSPEVIEKRQWFSWQEFQGLTLRYAWGNNYKNEVQKALR